MTFRPEGNWTRVTLVHSGWQKLGEKAAKAREGYDTGWRTVLSDHFVPACVSESR